MRLIFLQHRMLAIVLLCVCFTAACASKQGSELPAEYLEPSGWLEFEQTLTGANFAEYVTATEQLVSEHRVYFDAAKAIDTSTELMAVTPKEYKPGPECSDAEPRGIAILVHGLSDTAFAMQDLAEHLASSCFVARTVLLPGHGTRPGDLLVVDHHDWLASLRFLTQQAAAENDNIILGGFSLGAALSLTIATEKDSPVKSVIGISPAYTIAASRLARLSRFIDWAVPWLFKSPPDDYVRYGTAPLRSVSETVSAIRHMKSVLNNTGSVELPWLLIQSLDDSVVQPAENMDFHAIFAKNDRSRIVNFHSGSDQVAEDKRAIWIRGDDEALRVQGLTHVSVHISSENSHYGVNGDYRNCGLRSPRSTEEVEVCQRAESVGYGLWNKAQPAEGIWAISTFNPHFDEFTDQIDQFLIEP